MVRSACGPAGQPAPKRVPTAPAPGPDRPWPRSSTVTTHHGARPDPLRAATSLARTPCHVRQRTRAAPSCRLWSHATSARQHRRVLLHKHAQCFDVVAENRLVQHG
eukprot:3936244-Rhodomonas_salina.2